MGDAGRRVVYIHLVGALTVSAASGEGHEPIDALTAVAVQTVIVHVLTFHPKGRLVGLGTIPRGVWGVGQVGLGYFSDDATANTDPLLFEAHSIHQEWDGWRVLNAQMGAQFFGSVWWRLNSGVTADIFLEW